ncbi:MAG: LAGLIDADG family homing endonuclease, partial [Pyrinomonadaceae bacterium]
MKKIELPPRGIETLFGVHDQNIKHLESLLDVRVNARGQDLTVDGDPKDVATVEKILEDFAALFAEGKTFTDKELREAFAQIAEDRAYSLRDYFTKARFNPSGKKQVAPKSATQRRYIESIQDNDCVFGIGPAGTGKCIAADSLVLTGGGMIEIGALGAGVGADEYAPTGVVVHGLSGVERASHVYSGGETDTLKMTTRFGYSVEATPEHPLLTLDARGELAWKRADELRVGDVVALQRGQRMFGSKTATDYSPAPSSPRDHSSKPVALEELDAPLAYMLGVLTGDGCLTFRNRVILSSSDVSIVEAFFEMATRFGLHVFRNGGDRPYDYIIASSQLYRLLAHLGMSAGKAATKRVPRSILTAPEEIVTAFLCGLFDADGTVERRDGVVSLSSVSTELIRQVQIALLNFGIVAARSVKRGRYAGKPHVSHLLTMAGAEAERFHELIGFALERKRARRRSSRQNTNIDVIPCQGERLSEALRGAVFTRSEHKLFTDYRNGRRRPSYAKLEQLVEVLSSHGVESEPVAHFRSLLEGHLLFLEVAGIERTRAKVYDLTVPGSHSFVANGFVNHNSVYIRQVALLALMAQVGSFVPAREARV